MQRIPMNNPQAHARARIRILGAKRNSRFRVGIAGAVRARQHVVPVQQRRRRSRDGGRIRVIMKMRQDDW